MPTAQEIRDAIETRLQTLASIIQTRQNNYFTTRGRYWQGLITHSILPADGETTSGDRLTLHPTDQTQSWADVGFTSVNEQFALVIDVYNGPLGQGYVATVYVTLNGRTWTRSRNVGPETWRTRSWTELLPVDLQ